MNVDQINSIKQSTCSGSIDKNMLCKKDPFLFYQNFTIFEDELDDNGHSSFGIKIVSTPWQAVIDLCLQRIMEECFLVLAQMYSRIDHVSVKLKESRYFCKFFDPHFRLVKNIAIKQKQLSIGGKVMLNRLLICRYQPRITFQLSWKKKVNIMKPPLNVKPFQLK